MNTQELKEFLKSLRKTDIVEFSYQSEEESLSFKKNMTAVRPCAVHVPEPEAKPNTPVKNIVSIKSDVIGIFSIAQGEDEQDLFYKGAKVKPGQKVGQVEAMKIVKDIVSKVKGEIVEVCVNNGDKVDYGQKLFLVDTGK
jgi:biotin carboxyl carrier protein